MSNKWFHYQEGQRLVISQLDGQSRILREAGFQENKGEQNTGVENRYRLSCAMAWKKNTENG